MKKTLHLSILLLLASFMAFAQKKISVEDIFNRTFSEENVAEVEWMNDGQFYSSLENNNIVKMDVTTGAAVATLVEGNSLNPKIAIEGYSFSADEKLVLIQTDFESIYRRSFKAEYYVYDLASKKLSKLSSSGKQSYATFSPDGTKVAFARDNNLFYVELSTMKEIQVTDDGKFNHIINGSADWVYEEEFSFAQAFAWSADGQKIAYYVFDESKVKEYNMQMWNTQTLYPTDYRFKYPKAGEDNSVVNIQIYHLEGGKKVKVDIGTETDIYIPRINWTTDGNLLSVRRMNRLQNKLDILHADATTGKTEVVLTEENNTFVDINYCDDLTYLADGKHFINSSEKDGFKHLYLYKMNGKEVRQITKGNWEVTQFVGLDQQNNVLYYISTEISPLERHLYSVNIDGGAKQKLSANKGTNRANMSADFKYYLNYHKSASQPTTVALYQAQGNKQIKVLKDNAKLRQTAKEYGIQTPEFFKVSTKDGYELNGYLIKPADFDENKQYPLLIFVYGGPGSQNVLDTWGGRNDLWHQMLAQKGVLVACVDNRGTDGRGAAFKKATYANLGKYEVQDQIEAAKHLGSMKFIDENRIGIWGWSYGGYMSSLCMTLGADVFKAGIAVAPVSNWRYYDSIYTERFLQRPQDNAKGYDDYSPIYHADKLKGAFFLIHGTGDDNVHFQNAIAMQDALISANKQFKSFYYPNRNHGIYGGVTRVHLYNMMTNFVLESL